MPSLDRWLPTLRIHSWGGFGSQLYVVYLILRIRKKFPNRRLKVIVHTSGVTARTQEFDFSSLGVNVVNVDDFSSKHNTQALHGKTNIKRQIPIHLKNASKALLGFSRLLISANDEMSFSRIWEGTLSIRGHYTRLDWDKSVIESLFAILSSGNQNYGNIRVLGTTSIHYRLGDLLSLEGKSPVSSGRVEELISKLGIEKSQISIFSDSNRKDFELHAENGMYWNKANYFCLSPDDTISNCIKTEHFIGTTAKISLWIAVFRFFIFDRLSFLPIELRWATNNGLNIKWY